MLEQIAQAGFETNVIMLTGFATQRIASQAAQLGAIALLSKPILNSELVEKIQEVLKNQGSDRVCDRLKLFSAKRQKIQTYTG